MANTLPMTLRVYQKLSAAVVPLAPALIKRRLKLEAILNEATKRAYVLVGRPEGAGHG